MQFETALWDAINLYARTVGGDPSKHVYGNGQRMQAVAEVGRVISDMRAMAVVIDGVHEAGGADARRMALPTNPSCTGTVGKNFLPCGEEDYYCSDHCWTIGRLRAARAQVVEYERRLGVYPTRGSDPTVPADQQVDVSTAPADQQVNVPHLACVEMNPESFLRGGSSRTAVCRCGWRGPQRGTLELVVDDALEHERAPRKDSAT